MAGFIDLHTHSTCSDGSLTPKELVIKAKEAGLRAISLTDHDTIEGIEEAMIQAEQCGIEFIPGIEISASFKPEMHILGYFSKKNYKNIEPLLEDFKKNRALRNPKILKRLAELGYELTMEDVIAQSNGNVIGRPHIAKALVHKGYISSTEEAFDRFLSSGRAAFFKKDKLTPAQSIREILDAGGIPVLAHPIYLYLNNKELDKLLYELKSAGLVGIEACYVDNTNAETRLMLRLAKKHNLLITGGSDFHGSFKSQINLGVGRGKLEVRYEIYEKLRDRLPQ